MRIVLFLIVAAATLWGGIGTIAAMRGSAEILRASSVVAAKSGMDIEEKDTVTTAEKTKVQVILNDQTVVTIGPSSEYLFESFDDKNDPHASMELKRGLFKAVTGKLGKIAPQRFQIKTKSATIGIRGTYLMAYIDERVEKIGCMKGQITVKIDGQTLLIPAGSMALFMDGQWEIIPLDIGAFEPVLAGVQGGKVIDKTGEFELPGADEKVIIEDPAIIDRIEPAPIPEPVPEPIQEPFNIDVTPNTDPVVPPFDSGQ